jgi:hypothetical protein
MRHSQADGTRAVAAATCAAIATTLASACRAPSAYTELPSSPVQVVACTAPAGTTRATPAAADIRVQPVPTPADTSVQAVVRFEGPVGQPNTVRVAPSATSRFEPLAPGVYHLVVTMDGYQRLSARVSLTAGCTTTVTFGLRPRG